MLHRRCILELRARLHSGTSTTRRQAHLGCQLIISTLRGMNSNPFVSIVYFKSSQAREVSQSSELKLTQATRMIAWKVQ